jgi:hypothetical protein
MQSRSFDEDPQSDLPDCFRNEAYVEKLINGLKNLKKEGREEDDDNLLDASAPADQGVCVPPDEEPEWQPETLFRTCLSSLTTSAEFGPMMATEADARGFSGAKKKAFLGDGLGYNWTIQQRWFPEFIPITDFVHVVEYVHSAAKAIHDDQAARWQQYIDWATKCWEGRVQEVIDELDMCQRRIGPVRPGEDLPDGHPRKAIHSALTYFTNNRKRMNYPSYRRRGFPVTSSLAESLVKQVSKRVKGTEMFWNDGRNGEAILQIRAALLCDDDRLAAWLRTRPISPFSPRCRSGTLATSL